MTRRDLATFVGLWGAVAILSASRPAEHSDLPYPSGSLTGGTPSSGVARRTGAPPSTSGAPLDATSLFAVTAGGDVVPMPAVGVHAVAAGAISAPSKGQGDGWGTSDWGSGHASIMAIHRWFCRRWVPAEHRYRDEHRRRTT